MRTLFLLSSPQRSEELWLALENLGENWQGTVVAHPQRALEVLGQGDRELAIVEAAAGGLEVMDALWQHPPVTPPHMVFLGPCDRADLCLPVHAPVAQICAALETLAAAPALPRLTQAVLPGCTTLAQELLMELGLKAELRAAAFLPAMIAQIACYPPLLTAVTQVLYPRFAQSLHTTPAAVERNLRSALESLWSNGHLPALEKWFGHTVDPEKGRPTNREFLALAAEHVRRQGRALFS